MQNQLQKLDEFTAETRVVPTPFLERYTHAYSFSREDPGARSVESWSVLVHLVRRGAPDHSGEVSEIDAIEILCGPKPMQRIR